MFDSIFFFHNGWTENKQDAVRDCAIRSDKSAWIMVSGKRLGNCGGLVRLTATNLHKPNWGEDTWSALRLLIIKAEHRPGFHKRWSADPQPVPIGGTYFTICSLQPEVPSCRSCSSAALISCSPSRTSTLATYFNIWTIVHNYTHQKPSKEGL